MIFQKPAYRLKHDNKVLKIALIIFFIASALSGIIFVSQTLTTRQKASELNASGSSVPMCPNGTPRSVACEFTLSNTADVSRIKMWTINLIGDPNKLATQGTSITGGKVEAKFLVSSSNPVSCNLEIEYLNCANEPAKKSFVGTANASCPDQKITSVPPSATAIPGICSDSSNHICPFCLEQNAGGNCAKLQTDIPAGYSPPQEYRCLKPPIGAPDFGQCKPKGNPCTCTVWECRNETKGLFFAICEKGWREDRDGQHCDKWRVLGEGENPETTSCNGAVSPTPSAISCPVINVVKPKGVCK